jgi:hypothetical protein
VCNSDHVALTRYTRSAVIWEMMCFSSVKFRVFAVLRLKSYAFLPLADCAHNDLQLRVSDNNDIFVIYIRIRVVWLSVIREPYDTCKWFYCDMLIWRKINEVCGVMFGVICLQVVSSTVCAGKEDRILYALWRPVYFHVVRILVNAKADEGIASVSLLEILPQSFPGWNKKTRNC